MVCLSRKDGLGEETGYDFGCEFMISVPRTPYKGRPQDTSGHLMDIYIYSSLQRKRHS